jgi:hypothetical protein
MNHRKRKYPRLVFKLVLLAVYFAFFAVQLAFRFNASLAQQSLESACYQKNPAKGWNIERGKEFDNLRGKNKTLSYLNKRFHPKNAVIVSAVTSDFVSYYIPVVENSYFRDSYIAALKINRPSFRGPPLC